MALPSKNNAIGCLTAITRALNHFAFFRPWLTVSASNGGWESRQLNRAFEAADASEGSPGVSSADVETTHGRGGLSDVHFSLRSGTSQKRERMSAKGQKLSCPCDAPRLCFAERLTHVVDDPICQPGANSALQGGNAHETFSWTCARPNHRRLGARGVRKCARTAKVSGTTPSCDTADQKTDSPGRGEQSPGHDPSPVHAVPSHRGR
jgi:hypothetical protein